MGFHTTADSVPATETTTSPSGWPVSRRYAWIVFALSFGLLLSDYMSRQVLNAVFPMLKPNGCSPTPGWARSAGSWR